MSNFNLTPVDKRKNLNSVIIFEPTPVELVIIQDENDPEDFIVLMYHPEKRSREKDTNYSYINVPGLSDPVMHFISGGADKISLDFYLDARDGRTCEKNERSAIEYDVSWLRSKTVPEIKDFTLVKSPPVLLLIMGNEFERIRINKVRDEVVKFFPDGTAKQILVNLEMTRTIDKHRNPIDILRRF